MALFSSKTEEEKAADAARRAEAVYQASPQGRAAQAYDRGDEFLQIEIPHSSVTGFTNAAFNSATKGKIRRNLTRTDLLGQIEETGWHLEHADWVYIQTGQNSRDKFLASGQHVVVTGEVIGIYLFRRDESRGRAAGSTAKGKPIQKTAAPPKETSSSIAASNAETMLHTVEVRCFKCDHTQRVKPTITSFRCDSCGTQLKRKAPS